MASDSRALTLKLLADVADFQKKMDQSEKTTEGFSGKLGEFGQKAAAAFAVAGAAAAAYAGKLLVDGVKSAIEDEKAQAALAATLKNVTSATDAQIAATEDYITKTSLAFGVTDEELRPSLQRLAIATGDVTKAQNLQKLALDVAAGSGKSLDAVTQALAKAYEGNTSSLARLGVGLSTAELKTMTFDEATAALAKTFEGQASVQADTLQGKIARLQVGFDEAKEAVGARLLPIITQFLTFVTDRLIPGAESLVAKFKPITVALEDNKEEFKALWDFIKTNIVPILTGALKLAITGITTVITAAVTAVGKLVNGFQSLYDKYKAFVDFIKNNPLSKFLGKINPFDNASFTTSGFLKAGTGATGVTNVSVSEPAINPLEQLFGNPNFAKNLVGELSISEKKLLDSFFAAGGEGELVNRFRPEMNLMPIVEEIRARDIAYQNARTALDSRPPVNVNIGVVGDPESAARTIVDLLNTSYSRGTGGSGALF